MYGDKRRGVEPDVDDRSPATAFPLTRTSDEDVGHSFQASLSLYKPLGRNPPRQPTPKAHGLRADLSLSAVLSYSVLAEVHRRQVCFQMV